VDGADARHGDAPGPTGGDRRPPGRHLARLVSAFAYVGIAALIVAIILTCADIIWRRVVGGAFMDVYDVIKLCLVAAASWSIPYGFIHGTHVSVDLLAERFPLPVQRGLEVAISLVAAALLGFLLWLSWEAAQLRYLYGDTSPNLRIPMIYYWAILLSGLALAVVAVLWRAFIALVEDGRLR
jgi:TRAP-type C4-dicarboxylate transport system permease small subunit